jgi:hypothetical protein
MHQIIMPFNRRYTIDGATSLQQDWAPLPTNSIDRERERGDRAV